MKLRVSTSSGVQAIEAASVVVSSEDDTPLAVFLDETSGLVRMYAAGDKGFKDVVKRLGQNVDVESYKLPAKPGRGELVVQ